MIIRCNQDYLKLYPQLKIKEKERRALTYTVYSIKDVLYLPMISALDGFTEIDQDNATIETQAQHPHTLND